MSKLHCYKSTSNAEIDLIIETRREIRLIEVKASAKPGPRDLRHLKSFRDAYSGKKTLSAFLFHRGLEYGEEDGVRLLPIASLWRAR